MLSLCFYALFCENVYEDDVRLARFSASFSIAKKHPDKEIGARLWSVILKVGHRSVA